MEDVYKHQPKNNIEIKEKNLKLPIQWFGKEYQHYPKSSEWFWAVASGALLVIIISILNHNFLLGVLAIIAAFVIMLYGAKKPKKVKFEINETGVKIDKEIYKYQDINSFWIHSYPKFSEEPILILNLKNLIKPKITLPIKKENEELIRQTLLNFIEEKEEEESLIDFLIRLLRF